MKKGGLMSLFGIILISLIIFNNFSVKKTNSKTTYENYLKNHKYNQRNISGKELKAIPKKDRPDLAWEQDFLATMNPKTGRPEREKLFPILKQTKQLQNNLTRTPGSNLSPWVERGPNNVGGRSRAIAWDPTSANKVWAGSVSGGLWFNNDITNNNSSWQAVNDFWDNITVTTITFDPQNNQTIYVGTGEGWGAAATRGAGIWKSTDGGNSFAQLPSTANYFYINDLVVRNEGGTSVIYAASEQTFYNGQTTNTFYGEDGLFRSTDGGNTWAQVLPNVAGTAQTAKPTDLDIAADNTLWVATGRNVYGQGGGEIYSSADGTTFTSKYIHPNKGRVNLSCAPSNANVVYALFEAGKTLNAIMKTTDTGTTWVSKNEPNDADGGIPATDFTRGQAWYCLTIDIDPNNANTVLVGGIDLFKTTDGSNTWSQLSHWYPSAIAQYIHADQHAILYKNGSSTQVLFGNDGGVAYSGNANAANPTLEHRIKDFNITQFYSCAMNPTAGSNYFLAGAQDNGTNQFTTAAINATTEVTGGDGGFTHIDQTNPTYQITAYTNNEITHSSDGGNLFHPIISDGNSGKFINFSDLDNNLNILYSYKDYTHLYRVKNIESNNPSVATIQVADLGQHASHISVSPYTTASTTLFVGTAAGKLYKFTNIDTVAPGVNATRTDITGSLPTGNISCVAFGQNENELLVTYTNYGVNSVWYTADGGANWISKEGSLPDIPVRWALFNPLNYQEVILATEVGVWGTVNITATNPSWIPTNSGLANVRVDMLQLRTADNEVIAATHGRGLFSSDGFNDPIILKPEFIADNLMPSVIQTVQFTDNTNLNPTTWTWTFAPNTVTYQNGTTANSQNPQVIFNTPGTYTVTLNVSNGTENGTETKIDYITVTEPPYCTSVGNSNFADGVTKVIFNTIDNASTGANAYTDNTAITTDVIPGNSYDLTVNANSDGQYVEAIRVWIDWNKDYDFEDAGEQYDLGTVYNNTDGQSTLSPLSVVVPANANIGTTRMRVSAAYSQSGTTPIAYRGPCEPNYFGEVEDYTINILPASNCNGITCTWDGNNWSPNAPTTNDTAILNGVFDFTNTNIDCCELTVNAGITITVPAGSYMLAEHDITNLGTIIVENQGSIVQVADDATVTGTNFQIQKTTAPYIEYDYTYWSSPIENADLATVFSASQQNRIYDFTTANFLDLFDVGSPQTSGVPDSFDDDNNDWNVASGTMTVGKGYIVEGEGASYPFDPDNIATNLTQSVSFNGKINNGIKTYVVTLDAGADDYTNQNLIGNPYPSAIDIKLLQAANSTTLQGTYYFWTHGSQIGSINNNDGPDAYNFSNLDYATATVSPAGMFSQVASTGTISKTAPEFIASGQSFFADVTNAGNVTFNNNMRVTGNNNEFRNNTSYDRVWLNMTNDSGAFRQILVGFYDEATNNFDNGIDGKRLESGTNFDFYSILDTYKLAIQGLPLIVEKTTVPLGIKAPETGLLTINIDHFEGDLENTNIYLQDNLFDTLFDLKLDKYTFSIDEIGNYNNRFSLIFTKNSLAINNENFTNSDLLISKNGDQTKFSILNNTIKNIEIYDILGKMIVHKSLNSNSATIKLNVTKGIVLFAKIKLENGQILTKKFIK